MRTSAPAIGAPPFSATRPLTVPVCAQARPATRHVISKPAHHVQRPICMSASRATATYDPIWDPGATDWAALTVESRVGYGPAHGRTFFFTETAAAATYTLSLHDALPI